jgi:hypothetical protein
MDSAPGGCAALRVRVGGWATYSSIVARLCVAWISGAMGWAVCGGCAAWATKKTHTLFQREGYVKHEIEIDCTLRPPFHQVPSVFSRGGPTWLLMLWWACVCGWLRGLEDEGTHMLPGSKAVWSFKLLPALAARRHAPPPRPSSFPKGGPNRPRRQRCPSQTAQSHHENQHWTSGARA